MVLVEEQALEVQGVAALGARRKMLKTFKVVQRTMSIDDPTAPPPSPPPFVRPRRRRRLPLGARLVVVVGYPWLEQS